MGSGHPLDELSPEEIESCAAAVRSELGDDIRFNAISLEEPAKKELIAFAEGGATPARIALVIALNSETGIGYELLVDPSGGVTKCTELPAGVQPLLSPDDCFLAEEISKADPELASLLKERYGIEDMAMVACDPWSIHVTSADFEPLSWRGEGGPPPRLVQTFLYLRRGDGDPMADNHYAHPMDVLPVVDLNAKKVVHISMQDVAPSIPDADVNYHRDRLAGNSYLASQWRAERLAPLNLVQPEGPSFEVDGQVVTWQKWTFRVGFNFREGLVMHDVCYEGRPVMWRGSLVEMAVPYGDPREPFERKCAFDVGDYGLGFCANSLELGCDCLGHIHYFDAVLSDSKGAPYTDDGLLWKHVEYRNGHSEARRSRTLVVSFIATVVNYEYLFYWYLKQDGTIDFEIKLSGELSTNLLSEGEEAPAHGVMVAPGVNAQVHQHMFCARLDMAVDGHKNTVSEVDVAPLPAGPGNPYGNAFQAVKTPMRTEKEGVRVAAQDKARAWKIESPSSINPITGAPTAYKLIPFTIGPAMPTLMTLPECAVTTKGMFATKNLWVTKHTDSERWPAGDYTVQQLEGQQGLPAWTAADRPIEDEDVVLWHAFGVMHVPRAEDFPVMPCEKTGFSLKPDGFFTGNPGVDLPPPEDKASECCSHDE